MTKELTYKDWKNIFNGALFSYNETSHTAGSLKSALERYFSNKLNTAAFKKVVRAGILNGFIKERYNASTEAFLYELA